MGKWIQRTTDGRLWNQWTPTEKHEPVPSWDEWEGCLICGRRITGDPKGEKRLQLDHDATEHKTWTLKYRTDYEKDDLKEVMARMRPASEPERYSP